MATTRKTVLGRLMVLCLVMLAVALGFAGSRVEAVEESGHSLDPAHNLPLPCEYVGLPAHVPRSAKNIMHVANRCGFVGTDVEFQSRVDAQGRTRDYVFVGTMGGGLRIFDITNPTLPAPAGGYLDPGWQGDIQVRGDTAVIGFDPIAGRAPTLSTCLQAKGASGGVDIVRLSFDPHHGIFSTSLVDCVTNNPGGAHNSTLHPSGSWLALSNPRSNGTVDVVDLRGTPTLRYRIIESRTAASCPAGASFTCLEIGNATRDEQSWSPHDIHFSRNGNLMFVAAVNAQAPSGGGTYILEVSRILEGRFGVVSLIPNLSEPGGLGNARNIEISHQADVTSNERMLVITDERGGGLGETRCNRNENGIIGGMHFWAIKEIAGMEGSRGATPAAPRKIGSWIYPDPPLALDPLQPILDGLGRTERGCTIHVFRLGGNGTASPGPIAAGFDGVSRLPVYQTVSAHYGAGVWYIDFSSAPTDADGTVEDSRTTWGNTLGWNVMPGADTWSAKEYKGYIYAGDMTRGFDVYRFATCEGLECMPPTP